MKLTIRLSSALLLYFPVYLFSQSQGFINNGANIRVESGAYITMNDFTNNIESSTDGVLDLDGDLYITGNFANNTNGNTFINIETVPDGQVTLNGMNQTILGITPVFFENFKIIDATKTLSLNNCEVKGVFDIDGVFDLNKNKLIIDNDDPSAIIYESGYVKSETLPSDGLGEPEWKIGSTTGIFSVPFGSGSSSYNNLNTVLETKTAASPADGSVIFATFPANYLNEPYPDGVVGLDTLNAENLADRYWKIEPVYTTLPDVGLTFSYAPEDVDISDNPGMIEANLKAIRYNDILNTWLDMHMAGQCNAISKTVSVGDVLSADFFKYWTLNEFELKIPNAFTPIDRDGINDYFMKGYSLKIVNRWGEQLYEGNDGWDGTVNGSKASPGTYYYILQIPGIGTDIQTITGVITLIFKE